jgi:hypothetical protein
MVRSGGWQRRREPALKSVSEVRRSAAPASSVSAHVNSAREVEAEVVWASLSSSTPAPREAAKVRVVRLLWRYQGRRRRRRQGNHPLTAEAVPVVVTVNMKYPMQRSHARSVQPSQSFSSPLGNIRRHEQQTHPSLKHNGVMSFDCEIRRTSHTTLRMSSMITQIRSAAQQGKSTIGN